MVASTVVRTQARRRWLVVGAVAVALVAAPGAVAALPVGTPAIDVASLVARIRASAGQPFQGYAVSTGSAGLPALPQLSDVSNLFNGDTRMRIWYASAQRWRVDVIDTSTERDTYQLAGRQIVWDYGRRQLTELDGVPPVRLPQGSDLTPPDLARRLLAATEADPHTALPPRRIAGITAAGVRITPASPNTTVGRVDIWADPASGLPLAVSVTGRGATAPVLTTRFLDVALRTPAEAVLSPPPVAAGIGYTVTDAQDVVQALRSRRPRPLPDVLAGQARSDRTVVDVPGVAVYGTGLAQFAVLAVPRQVGFDAMHQAVRGGGVQLQFPDGDGVLIHTPLLSVLAMDAHPVRANYLVAGFVDPALLKQAGAELSSWGSVR